MLPLLSTEKIVALAATQKVHLFQDKANTEFEARALIELLYQRGEALAKVAVTFSHGEQVEDPKWDYRPRLQ